MKKCQPIVMLGFDVHKMSRKLFAETSGEYRYYIIRFNIYINDNETIFRLFPLALSLGFPSSYKIHRRHHLSE